ncbi:MAG TPA: SDR family oxidoreductase, partial [Tepidisphaeraceae bacterium]
REALVIAADVSRAGDVARVVEGALAKFGRVDALVNNAGYAPVRSIEEMTLEEWRAVLDTNLSAAFYFCKALWGTFRRQGGGVVVNISSAAARNPFDGFAGYGAAKAGLNLFTLAAAREGQKIGVRVHAIAPAATETAMFRSILSKEQYPEANTLSPEDVARVVGECVGGTMRYTSGEVIYLHKVV